MSKQVTESVSSIGNNYDTPMTATELREIDIFLWQLDKGYRLPSQETLDTEADLAHHYSEISH